MFRKQYCQFRASNCSIFHKEIHRLLRINYGLRGSALYLQLWDCYSSKLIGTFNLFFSFSLTTRGSMYEILLLSFDWISCFESLRMISSKNIQSKDYKTQKVTIKNYIHIYYKKIQQRIFKDNVKYSKSFSNFCHLPSLK